MFEKLHIPIAGVIENMSGFIAPDTGKEYDIFGKGGAKLCEDIKLKYLRNSNRTIHRGWE